MLAIKGLFPLANPGKGNNFSKGGGGGQFNCLPLQIGYFPYLDWLKEITTNVLQGHQI